MRIKTTCGLFSLLAFYMLLANIVTLSHAAEVPSWKMIPEKSSLSFTATQNGAPVTGTFKSFTAEIKADPDQLDASHVKIIVDMNSVTTSLKDIENALRTNDWFNVAGFPQAIFESSKFTKIQDKTLQANGTLSLKGKSLPVILVFTYEKVSPNTMKVTGSTQLIRADFGVGQGDWTSTEEIKNEVQVNFDITAITNK